jgi:glutamate racemase
MNYKGSIGIFDSGIGGSTVLKKIIKILPQENYIYYSDSINNPYGDKSDEEIKKLCDNIVQKLIQSNCKAIVIACNTASAKAARFLRKKYKEIPIIAIEPAYKMVHDFAYEGRTLVMATKGTIESEKFNLLFNKYNNQKTDLLACKGLADIIEEGNKQKIEKYLNENLSKYKNKVENVVLGCTHYPLIQEEIKNVLGDVKFFNGAQSLAKHLKEVLKENNLLNMRRR